MNAIRNTATFFALAALAAGNVVPDGNPGPGGRKRLFAGDDSFRGHPVPNRVKAFNQSQALWEIMKHAISQVFIRHGWIIGLLLIAWPSASLAGGISASSASVENSPAIRVEVYNYARVGCTELHEAEGQAADLFASAGVRVVWKEFAGQKQAAPSLPNDPAADLFVRIFKASAIRRVRRISAADVLGEAILAPGSESPVPGAIANVFYDRVQHVSAVWGLSSGQVLGDAIAHELGHLLGARHSRRGIMKTGWSSGDLMHASRGQLRFSPPQVGLLQHAALELHSISSPMVLARR
jgi:hypothetical protein